MRNFSWLFLVGLVGCSGMAKVMTYGAPERPTFAPRDTLIVRGSEFEPQIEIDGIEANVDSSQRIGSNPMGKYLLRSWIEKSNGRVTHQLYVRDVYWTGGWRNWMSASGEDAKPLAFTSIAQDVNSCSGYSSTCFFTETFGVDVPDSTLRARSDGYRVKVYAKTGIQMILAITPAQIHTQVAALDSIRKRANAP